MKFKYEPAGASAYARVQHHHYLHLARADVGAVSLPSPPSTLYC
jgi:hypothetical protein